MTNIRLKEISQSEIEVTPHILIGSGKDPITGLLNVKPYKLQLACLYESDDEKDYFKWEDINLVGIDAEDLFE
jgi:hypothetical protein